MQSQNKLWQTTRQRKRRMWSNTLVTLTSLSEKGKPLCPFSGYPSSIMEYLRSLFGSLQQALDFVSSFTTYLFGNEPHPRAEEEPGSEREMKNYRSHHDSEVGTECSGDVSPRDRPKVTEGPFTAEITPLSQEIQETLVFCDQAMESFLSSSKIPNRCEEHEEPEQKFSVSSVCLSDTPELGSTTPMTDNIQQTHLEASTMTERLDQRKSEESTLMNVVQEDMIEDLADAVCSQYWKPEELLAERRKLEQMEEAEKTRMDQEAEQDRTVLEQKRRLEEAEWIGEIVQDSLEERAEIMGNRQLEVEKEREERKVGEEEQEEINASMLDQTKDERDVLKEERTVGKSQLWDEEAEKVRENQKRELENMLRNEGIQQKLLDWAQDREEKQRGQEDATWTGKTQQDRLEEMAKLVREQQLNVEKEQEEDTKVDGDQQVRTSGTAETEGDQVKMLEEKGNDERSWNLEEWIGETEQGKERKLDEEERELEGVTWTDKLNYDAINVTIVKHLESGEEHGEGMVMDTGYQIIREIATKKEEAQQPLLDKGEMEANQKKALEGEENERDIHWEPKETEIVTEQKREVPELEKGGHCQQGDLPEKGKTEEELKQEAEESVKNETHATGEKQEQQTREEWWENNQEEQPEILVDTSGLSEEMLEEAETTADQSSQLRETTKNLAYPTSLDKDLMAGPRVFPHDVTTLDSSAQKERVLLRRKSSIRRAPSLKKPKTSEEASAQETNIAEDTPSSVPKRQNPRLSGFGPMHPNMMAELQMRLKKPK